MIGVLSRQKTDNLQKSSSALSLVAGSSRDQREAAAAYAQRQPAAAGPGAPPCADRGHRLHPCEDMADTSLRWRGTSMSAASSGRTPGTRCRRGIWPRTRRLTSWRTWTPWPVSERASRGPTWHMRWRQGERASGPSMQTTPLKLARSCQLRPSRCCTAHHRRRLLAVRRRLMPHLRRQLLGQVRRQRLLQCDG